MASKSKQKEILRDWPHISGLGADDKHEGRKMSVPNPKAESVPRRLVGNLED